MTNQLTEWQQQQPYLAARGIDEPTWNALCNTLYAGSSSESVIMVVDYCRALKLDPMQKPVHIVQINHQDPNTKRWGKRDVVMPGIGLYRIQAARSGDYAGSDEPVLGPIENMTGKDGYGNAYNVSYPTWCTYTVYKIVRGQRVPFVAKVYWIESYGQTNGGHPNSMWQKRPISQLVKCAESAALQKAWPEISPMADQDEPAPMVDITPPPQPAQAPVIDVTPEPEPEPVVNKDQKAVMYQRMIVDKIQSNSTSVAECRKLYAQAASKLKNYDALLDDIDKALTLREEAEQSEEEGTV